MLVSLMRQKPASKNTLKHRKKLLTNWCGRYLTKEIFAGKLATMLTKVKSFRCTFFITRYSRNTGCNFLIVSFGIFGHGLHASNRFSGRYETILWFSKTDDYIFNLDNVRVPSKYPGKRHFKGQRRAGIS